MDQKFVRFSLLLRNEAGCVSSVTEIARVSSTGKSWIVVSIGGKNEVRLGANNDTTQQGEQNKHTEQEIGRAILFQEITREAFLVRAVVPRATDDKNRLTGRLTDYLTDHRAKQPVAGDKKAANGYSLNKQQMGEKHGSGIDFFFKLSGPIFSTEKVKRGEEAADGMDDDGKMQVATETRVRSKSHSGKFEEWEPREIKQEATAFCLRKSASFGDQKEWDKSCKQELIDWKVFEKTMSEGEDGDSHTGLSQTLGGITVDLEDTDEKMEDQSAENQLTNNEEKEKAAEEELYGAKPEVLRTSYTSYDKVPSSQHMPAVSCFGHKVILPPIKEELDQLTPTHRQPIT